QLATAGNAEAALVDMGALALLRPIELVVDRVVDDAGIGLAVALDADRDREMRNAVQEVEGAVERVDDPAVGGVLAGGSAALLQQQAVVGPGLGQLALEDIFRTEVGLGDEVRRALLADLEVLDLAEIADQSLRGLVGGIDHDIDERRTGGHGRTST